EQKTNAAANKKRASRKAAIGLPTRVRVEVEVETEVHKYSASCIPVIKSICKFSLYRKN
ncbi:hypothetical protein MKW92_005534, partial [Papaver armeniacum]